MIVLGATLRACNCVLKGNSRRMTRINHAEPAEVPGRYWSHRRNRLSARSYALAYLVDPKPREISVTVPPDRFYKQR